MICSEARVAANRRNALRSTGPRTPEGKAISRANSLKHGLCATVVVPEDPDLVKQRSEDLFYALKPQDEYQAWAVEQAATLSLRLDRCRRMERRLRDKVCLRAELTWDDDRILEAEALGAMLARRPAEVVPTLRRTAHGCDWLMARWALLAHAADTQSGGWTEGQKSLAFDLLATPIEFRQGHSPGAAVDFEGHLVGSAVDPAAVARREVAALRERRDAVGDLDEVERSLSVADLNADADPDLRRMRRYESGLHNKLKWYIGQLGPRNVLDRPRHDLRPRWADTTEAAEPKTPEEELAEGHDPRSFSPPFDLRPEEYPEPGQRPDLPKILASRKARRREEAEARREARREKVDRLRTG